MNCFALLLVLVLTGSLHKAECKEKTHFTYGLQRPYRVRWYIEKSALIVSWEHKSGSKGPPKGFYIQLQELVKKGEHGPPDYVQVKNSHGVKVYGLKPNAQYALKVVAFTEDEHKPSHRIHVNTTGLGFLEASNFDVSSITDTSAVFSWHHSSQNNVHDVQFELKCKGVQEYTRDRKKIVDEVEFVRYVQATSREKETFLVTDLVPNTQYDCSIQTVADKQASEPHDKLHFMTESGNPNRPPTPRVMILMPNAENLKDRNLQVDVFETDDQYGPISHYTVHAVPVYVDPSSPRSIPYAPHFPYPQLLTESISLRKAMDSPREVPFIVGKYGGSNLPYKLYFIESKWGKAFKHSSHYVFVVVAYSNTKDGAEIKYSLSEPSDPIFISDSMEYEWQNNNVLARFVHIVVGTVIAFAIGGLLALATLLIVIYWRRKRRMKWSMVDSASDNSDAEASNRFMRFGMRKSKRKKKVKEKTVDDNPRPKKNLAEWAIKKFQRNPEFDAMVYRSPENIKEMEELLQQNTIPSDESPRPPSPARLEEVKMTNNNMEEESMPLLASTTPHPTSPLLQSKLSQNAASNIEPSSQRKSFAGRYSTSSVAAAVVHDEYLRGSYTLPHHHYDPPASSNGQHYYKTHKPGTPMPTTVTPKVPVPRSQSPPSPLSPKPYMRVHEDIILN